MLLMALSPAMAQSIPIDRIVAVVNDDVVMQSELSARLDAIKSQIMAREGRLPDEDALRRQVLERMIIERVQLQQAARIGIRIDDITLNNTIENIARENKLTLEAFREVLAREGVDLARFREQIREEMTIAQLRRRQVDNRIQVTDQEIDDLIASESGAIDRDVEYRLAHILVALPEAATPEQIQTARDAASALRERALAGEDFGQLAISHSDAQQALEGGDLGWRASSQIPTLFSRQVVLMNPGDVSEPIRSPNGFHVVKLVDRRGSERSVIQQTRVRHILIRPNELLGDEQARARAANLRQRILNGDDFAELARANSDDKSSAIRGGDLDWANPGDLVPQFEAAMNELKPGEISEPVRSTFGWHLIEVLDRRAHDSSQQMIRVQARDFIRERKREEELELWLQRLRDESFVEYRLQ
ncbi:MAG: peptidylprolyl isomerase [Chromatiales bacterium]|nr:peptidylprolyl isomerase [Chromatiales bacterium]MDX9768406.1 peptidylprolyl isomerase [Ectothiorhodospiraceae bacterium]